LNPVLDNAIMAFVEHQEQREHEIIEDVLYLIDEAECQIADYIEVPKVNMKSVVNWALSGLYK
jgi:hypothetical protein